MRKLKRMIAGLLCSIFILCGCAGVSAEAAGIVPYYDNTSSMSATLSFYNDIANCSITVVGQSGTSKITGTVSLYDETSKYMVTTWAVLVNGSVCSFNNSAIVHEGHTYTLAFSGYVYNAEGVGEYVTISKTKTN